MRWKGAAYEHELGADGFDRARDVLVEARVARLEDDCVIFPPSDK